MTSIRHDKLGSTARALSAGAIVVPSGRCRLVVRSTIQPNLAVTEIN
jgi:hypothetical protein